MKYENATLSYGERTILRNVSLNIEPGEFIFLIGASGSGKTSFIKSLLWAKKLKSGHIFDDKWKDIASFSPKELLAYRRSIGTIFQDFKLLLERLLRKTLHLLWKYADIIIMKSCRKYLKYSQKLDFLQKDKFIETLSGGEIQRTCIARALIHEPRLIIWDEPTGNLDRANAVEIMHLLEELHLSGKTIIIATHDEVIVNTMKKRVIAFKDGKIISDIQWGDYCL